MYLLSALGADVRFVGPSTLVSPFFSDMGFPVYTHMEQGIAGCEIVMMLRLQTERTEGREAPSQDEYYKFFGLDSYKLQKAAPNALIMHPGPMNRGIEIDTKLADDINKSVIKEQVELGVAVRMACLKLFCE